MDFFSQIGNNFDMDLFMDALGIMGKGMLGIFIVIVVIWALVALLNRTTKNKQDQQESGT